MNAAVFDAQEFRKALGAFATGVTIITTSGADGAPVGLTANSFNSVSLDPPMVLWSLANSAASLGTFRRAEYWAVHVLASDQEELSARFARRGIDKFAGLEYDAGRGGIPLLRGCMARFVCRTASQYEGGDHLIFVGEVLDFDRSEAAPLVFHAGRYAHATHRDSQATRPREAALAGSFSEDFLGYLLGRSHFAFFGQLRDSLEREGLNDMEFYVLSTLSLQPILSDEELARGLPGIAEERWQQALDSLVMRGFAHTRQRDGVAYELSERGRRCALRLISQAKALESKVLERFDAGEAAALKSLLGRLLGAIDEGADAIWKPR
ncbi:3-hydroxy-9,10-secoandrosta-1,3,5(10)-triene-9,17-dione monooxygenase reductase component [Solimonas aquatica]|uniref:3-hydroxy-9,10-secoandrosta-1,3,5(10)-triene-9,17-dione monooxygenase reductase component n=1 Tax=Solimonas aquatica TaxID=489703 RepID=A0A1H9F0U8_9GAMM|nr:flavin reductase [Solimonas aquatica]SEQ30848.1 3-hydroxy-9,10-secoandrosta-1,3,5(10)-triene-9,17-dione monooxygenase reductase component [Solimonas aquatica]